MDAIPVLSQTKSFIQFACGQKKEAKQTQINFSRQCPVVSQVRSAVEGIKGDKKAARETQKECGRFLLNLVNGVPVVGHIKGGIQYALGDSDAGDVALKAASHTSGVMAGGAVGFLVCGPVGAVVLGIGGGAAMDATITAVDTQIKGKLQPYGFVEPFADPKNAGKWCDAVGGIIFDGLTGHATGALVKHVQAKVGSGAATAASGAAVAPVEDDLFVRTLRNGARPFGTVGVGKLVMKLKEGTVYLLKDGRLKKFQDIFARVIKRNTTTGHAESEAINPVVPTNVPQFYSGDFVIRISGNILEIYESDNLILFIKENKVYIKDASGNDMELQEDHIYTKNPSGEVTEIRDVKKQNYIEKVIREQEEFSDACSVIETESVYQDRQSYILDMEVEEEKEKEEDEEEKDFTSRDDVLQFNGEEHPRLVRTNAKRWSSKRAR